jgi:serine/threonine protein kinase
MNPAGPRPASPGASDRLAPGTQLSRKVRIDGLLGEGGMAIVYRGHHLLLDEPVAVKIMRRELVGMKDVVARFLREARAAAKVRSEHAVTVYDVDELDGVQPYMLMELLEGEDLAARTDRLGRIPMYDAVSYVLSACVAVRVAHDAGIVHRDIKPANLFLARTRSGAEIVKVLDFGISKHTAPSRVDGPPLTAITRVGSVLGSPRYMAPEQMVDARSVDARADVWSLACSLYTLLHGRPAFEGETIHIICASVLSRMPAPLHPIVAGVPPELDAVLAKAMAKSRDDRYADVAELVRALAPFAAARPGAATEQPSAVSEELSTPRMAERSLPATAASRASGASVTHDAVGSQPDRPPRVHSALAMAPTMMSLGAVQAPGAVSPSTFDGMRAPDVPIASAATGRRWPLAVACVVALAGVATLGAWRMRTTPSPAAEIDETSPSSAPSSKTPADSLVAPSSAPVGPIAPGEPPPAPDSATAPSVASDAPAPAAAPAKSSPPAPRPREPSRGPRGPEPSPPTPQLPDPFAGEQK